MCTNTKAHFLNPISLNVIVIVAKTTRACARMYACVCVCGVCADLS